MLPDITTPFQQDSSTHVFHQYTILSPRREAIMTALSAAGIGCAIYYPIPLHRQEVFAAAYRATSMPVAERVANQCLSLPIFPEMTDSQIDSVVSTIRRVLLG